MLRVQIIDDDAGDRKLIKRLLMRSGLNAEIREYDRVDLARADLEVWPADLTILDFQMPDTNGLDALRAVKDTSPETAIVMVTGQGDEEVASEAIKNGAVDYIPKRNLSESSIERIVKNALAITQLQLKTAKQHGELETFAHILAHDLKAPLLTIGGLALFALDDIEANDVESVREAIRNIQECAERGITLITALSQHIRLDGAIALESCDIGDLARSAVANLQSEIDTREADVRIISLPTISCSPAEIVQLFQNLIGNAIKYCEGRSPQVTITSDVGSEAEIIFSVRDNGIGIPADKARYVFEPFKRLHARSQFAGTGLGLATCQKIVNRHGGKIWCEPEAEEGTIFRFTLSSARISQNAA